MCREKRPGSCGRHQDISLGAGRCSGVFVTQGQHASPPQCGLPRVVGSRDECYRRCGLTEAVRGICRAGGVREHYVTWEIMWRAAPLAGHEQLGGQRTGHEG